MMKRILGAGVLAAMAAPALAQYNCPNVTCNQAPATGRQVNISGATLLRGFFFTTAHTNDFVDVDNNGCFGFDDSPVPPCFPNVIDSLAPGGNYDRWWIVQNRAVGSVEGFSEFISFQLCCDTPEVRPTDESTINSQVYTNGSSCTGAFSVCTQDNDADAIISAGCSPICPCSIDIAIIDVPSRWASQGAAGVNNFARKPGQLGYGVNPNLSIGISNPSCTSQDPGPFGSNLASLTRACTPIGLNTNTDSPDDRTIFDFPFTSAPVVPIANRGTGLENVTFTDLRYLQVTGRMPNGENLAAGTRDAGSGTRNAWANSLGVDPSWAGGDNRGGRTSSSARTNLGPCHRVTNCGSSSHLENAVQQRRLAVGYTGIAGSTAAVADALAGFYEILNVKKDIAGGTQFVRPTVTSCVNNDDINAGYQISGPAVFTTRGDIGVSSPKSPSYNPTLPQAMANEDAADYLYNIQASVAAFIAPGGSQNQNNLLMPGQFLATTFFLLDGLDARQNLNDPVVFDAQTPNVDLRAYILANNNLGTTAPADGIVTPAFGSVNRAGLVPNRTAGAYGYRNASGTEVTIGAGVRLGTRNRIQGDFQYDYVRNCNDIDEMVAAFAAGRSGTNVPLYQESPTVRPTPSGEPIDAGAQDGDVIIVDILGDMNGDGTFDAEDIRYAADGTAIVGGALNRQCGFTTVDNAWTVGAPGRPAGNFFNTTIVNACGASRPYVAGASRFDVTGSTSGPARGDNPIGGNGVVNAADLAYIQANAGAWTDLNDAAEIDLSCDMNGDLVVDLNDARALVEEAWASCFGDINCDGAVAIDDLALLLANFGTASGATYATGDLTGNGQVAIDDLALLLASFGGISPACN